MGGRGARRKRNWRHNRPNSPYFLLSVRPYGRTYLGDNEPPQLQQEPPDANVAVVHVADTVLQEAEARAAGVQSVDDGVDSSDSDQPCQHNTRATEEKEKDKKKRQKDKQQPPAEQKAKRGGKKQKLN